MKSMLYIVVLSLLLAVFAVMAYADVSLVNQYDPNGNLVSGDGKYYEYNEANQLAKVREIDQNGNVIAEYFYDFAGQRVKKVENGVTTYYIGKHYETNVVAGKTENTRYFFADGERVAKKDSTGTYFYHPDHLGGVNAVTDTAKTVVAKTSYLPFGEIRQGGQEKFSYTGKEKDKATDLYYFDARFNSPELRHFTQADIAEPDFDDPQDLNKYAYVGNNPLSFVDPDGYKKKKKSDKHKKKKKKKKKDDNKKENKESQDKEYAFEKYNPGSNGGECTDLAKAITTGYSGRLGWTIDDKKALVDSKGFRRGEQSIKVGNIIVLNEGDYGHVAIVIGIDNGSLRIIESNVVKYHTVSFRTISKNSDKIYGAYDTDLQ